MAATPASELPIAGSEYSTRSPAGVLRPPALPRSFVNHGASERVAHRTERRPLRSTSAGIGSSPPPGPSPLGRGSGGPDDGGGAMLPAPGCARRPPTPRRDRHGGRRGP